MSKLAINYVLYHRNVTRILLSDPLITPYDLSLYTAIFSAWNDNKFEEVINVYREDLMRDAKIGNKNTYSTSLQKLHRLGYIIYNPSHNPQVASSISFPLEYNKSGTTGGITPGTTTGKTPGTTGGTIIQTLETLETEREGADAQKSFSEIKARPDYAPTYEQVQELLYRQQRLDLLEPFMQDNDENGWKFRSGEPIVNWQAWLAGYIRRNVGKPASDDDGYGNKIDRKKHPAWPPGYPYTPSNIYRQKNKQNLETWEQIQAH